jgi:uncharacterized protein (TIGR04255 family)
MPDTLESSVYNLVHSRQMPDHYRQYPNAPITEALVDLRVTYDPAVSLDKLKAFGQEIKSHYPHENTRDFLQGEFRLEGAAGPQAQATRTTIGYIFHANDRSQAVQVRLDGFTFSRFPKYKDWSQLIGETRRLWGIFCRMFRPRSVVRIAVRYVNQINLPLNKNGGGLRFEDYLATFPEMRGIPENIALEGFFLRLVVPQDDLSAKLVVNEALMQPQADTIGIILDIDLFRENLSLEANSPEIWDILDSFRERKNRYFEASITDATRELFN